MSAETVAPAPSPPSTPARSARRRLLRHAPFVLLLAAFAAAYGALVLLRHHRFSSNGADLGIFDQAIWHYSNFEAPASTIRGFDNLLGDHFHPILVLAAPFMWVWDDARVLLLLQVALLCLAAVPVYLFGRSRFGVAAGLLWSAAFLAFWGVQEAIFYDFHEIAFAVPLISFGLWLTLERRFVPAACCIAALLLVKEDLSFLVAAFGVVMLWYRQWWLGGGLIAGGLAWFVLVTKVLIPHFAGGREFQYWTYTQFGDDAPSALKTVVTQPWKVVEVLFDQQLKRGTGILLVGVFAFLPFASVPALILLVPLIGERFLSTNAAYWGSGFHYSATVAPVLTLGAIHGLANLRRLPRLDGLRPAAFAAVAGVCLLLNVGVTVRDERPLYELTQAETWEVTPEMRTGHELLDRIPDDASVTAQHPLLPHLTHRDEIYDLVPDAPPTDYVVANLGWGHYPTTDEEYRSVLRGYRDRGYHVAFAEGNWVLLTREPPPTPVPPSPALRAIWGGGTGRR